MQNVKFLKSATLRGALLRGLDCRILPEMRDHIEQCFGDATVLTPVEWTRPDHWPTWDMGMSIYDEWKEWKKEPETYQPPDPPETAE